MLRKEEIAADEFEVGEELTPTLKIKRNVALDRYNDLIEEMYVEE